MIFQAVEQLVAHLGTPGPLRARIGLCHGCFDVVHIGHVEHLDAASTEVDVLVVSLTADAFVAKAGRPIFDERTRARVMASLRPVDHVVITAAPHALDLIDALRPDVYFKGADYAISERTTQHANFHLEAQRVRQLGGTVELTSTPMFSSTRTLELLGVLR